MLSTGPARYFMGLRQNSKMMPYFFLIKTHKKKIDKNSREKLSTKINIIQLIFFLCIFTSLIHLAISNNTHKKNCQKPIKPHTRVNLYTFLNIRIFAFMGELVLFYRKLIILGLINYIEAFLKLLTYHD